LKAKIGEFHLDMTTSTFQKISAKRVWKELRKNKRFFIIDLALFVASLLLFITNEKDLFLRLVFVLLIYGAFFWSLLAFFYRVCLWIPISTIAILTDVYQGAFNSDELIEIPFLILVLLMVFGIARRRTSAETALRVSEKQYRRLVELAFESIIIIVEEKFAFVNAQAVKLFSASCEADLIGESIGKYLHPASFEGFRIWTSRIISERSELPLFEEQFVRQDNSYIDVEVAGLVITYQNQPALLFVIRNITERKQAEKMLRESNTRFQDLLESAPDAVVVSDKDGVIVLVNAKTEEIFGYARQELVGKSVEKLLPEHLHNTHAEHRHNYVSQPKLYYLGADADIFGRRKDGSEFPIDVKLSPFFTEDGLRITTIIRDITERKRAEEQVVRAARLAALGQMSAVLAHELNNPLQIIKGYLDIMLDFPTEWEEICDYLQIIRQQINRMHSDAQNVLNYARPNQKPSQLVNLAEVIRQVLVLADKQLQQHGIRVMMDIDDVPLILAAPDSLSQVFLNLVINAIESSNDANRSLHVAIKSDEAQVVVSFASDGPAIPDKDLPYIFDPFFTTKPDGSGLGLWISRNLVEQCEGKLAVENLAGGQGVISSVMFPRALEEGRDAHQDRRLITREP
jgi:PAS domain S-box-containing protein